MSLKRIRISLQATHKISMSTIALFALLVFGLFTWNTALIIQNKKLRAVNVVPSRTELKVGSVVPTLTGLDIEGRKVALDFSGNDRRKSVLFVFAPRCGYCEQNMPNWKAIVDRIDRNSYRMLGVSLASDGLKEYLSKYQMPGVPVIAELDPQSIDSYGFKLTPQTLVIDGDGRVENIWSGIIEPSEWRALGLSIAR